MVIVKECEKELFYYNSFIKKKYIFPRCGKNERGIYMKKINKLVSVIVSVMFVAILMVVPAVAGTTAAPRLAPAPGQSRPRCSAVLGAPCAARAPPGRWRPCQWAFL